MVDSDSGGSQAAQDITSHTRPVSKGQSRGSDKEISTSHLPQPLFSRVSAYDLMRSHHETPARLRCFGHRVGPWCPGILQLDTV